MLLLKNSNFILKRGKKKEQEILGNFNQMTGFLMVVRWQSLLMGTCGHTEELLFVPSLQQPVNMIALILVLFFF